MGFHGKVKVAIMSTNFTFFLWLLHTRSSLFLFVLLLFCLFSSPSVVPQEPQLSFVSIQESPVPCFMTCAHWLWSSWGQSLEGGH